MNRRRFLTLSGAAASMSALGVASAKGCLAATPDIDAARREATRVGKPLLVALVPDAARGGKARGEFWGQVFSVGGEELLADLALCELVFHPYSNLRALADEGGSDIEESDFAVLLETDGSHARHIVGPVTHDPDPADAGLGLHDLRARSRADNFGKALRKVVAPDADTLARRAQQSRDSQPNHSCYEAASFLNVRPKLDALDRIAAQVRARIEASEAQRETWVRHLAQAALLRLWEQDPRGAKWDVLELDPCPPCGMAFVPETSRHFLDLYVR